MKLKMITLLTSVFIFCSSIAYANTTQIYLNEKLIKFDVQPQTENGRVLVPLRTIFESLNASVQFNSKTKTIEAYRIGSKIKLTLNNKTAYKNSIPVKLDVPAKQIKGRTVVPLRFIGESMNTEVSYDKNTNSVLIYDKGFVKNPNFKPENNNTANSSQPLEFDYVVPDNLMEQFDLEVNRTGIVENLIGVPEIKLLIVNNSKKTVVAFEYECSFLDGFDRPVYETGTLKNTIYKGIVQGVRIEPESVGISTGNLSLWNLATKIKPNKDGSLGIKLTRVKFSDNSEWTP